MENYLLAQTMRGEPMSSGYYSRRASPGVWAVWLIGILAVLGLVGVVLLWRWWPRPEPQVEPRAITPRGDLAADEKTNIKIYNQTIPSVVHITSLSVRRNPFSLDITRVPKGTGTGVIWDELGHVVTNFHVIQGGAAAQVTLWNQTGALSASLVGADQARDLAVLRISTSRKLQKIPIGESKNLQVGQKVYAIGNPFGLDYTLTTGIISGLGREVASDHGPPLRGLIQTDAPINPGNSGGPLMDSAGRMIGIDCAIISPSGASAGIGFAIPVDDVNIVVTKIINRSGPAPRQTPPLPSLGVDYIPDHVARRITQQLSDQLDMDIDGVLFSRVVPGSPAAKAGLRPTTVDPDTNRILVGDIILKIDKKSVTTKRDVLSILSQHRPGDAVTLTILRGDENQNVDVTLGEENEKGG
jgi:S1-C subfamily serine protease